MLKFKAPSNFKRLSNNLYINSKYLKKLNKSQKNILNSVYSNQEVSSTSIGSN